MAILSQPDWRSCDAWRTFGRPRLFFAISAGNMDSMINHYTANRKVRNDDAYSPGGQIGRRPDRATLAYCQRAREAYKGVPIIAGGVEAQLRRLAHYDYWSDKVRRPIILDCKADLLVFGMGERPIVEIARRLNDGATVRDLRDIRGVCYRLGAKEAAPKIADGETERQGDTETGRSDTLVLPDFDAVADRQCHSQARVLRHDADLAPGDESLQRAAARAVSRRGGGRRQPAGVAALAARDGPRLRPALHAQAASQLRRR